MKEIWVFLSSTDHGLLESAGEILKSLKHQAKT